MPRSESPWIRQLQEHLRNERYSRKIRSSYPNAARCFIRETERRYKEQDKKISATLASAVKPGSIMACAWDFPELMDNPFDKLFQIYITPEETLLLFVNEQARHIYTDREHPAADEMWPTALGNSVGHWEGDTLKIDIIGRRSGPFVRIPHILSPDLSEQARFAEAIRLVAPDSL